MIHAIRPEPCCSATVAAGAAEGLAIEGYPLFEMHPVPWTIPPAKFDGLLLGSANALRHGGPPMHELVDKPVYAVGEATAEAARQCGFPVARAGTRNLQHLLDGLVGQNLRLLRVAGRERVAATPPSGVVVEAVTAYEARSLPLPGAVAERLSAGALVLLHSAAAARHFAAECDRLRVRRNAICLAALAPRVAQAAGAGWRAVRSAAAPNEAALLALAREMCHDPRQD
jgi:uroporphyrinogen-III synthase